ncbi:MULTISPECIES: helix-turn-helix domain-containing protein [unclassified Breznakia]|uniref:AraC family transcriptional regulator n=1 Tax=unclassified Breznakia TaxID=2623764 RepID=UPI0024752143|nr:MULTISPECIES: helix-turn-helix domain-containing protein [unclassified Breznakia]MDH6366802.1 putative transcriptional regulator YdeE [Breznakia sp. PH1-1]MDH6403811.1 putative transcriptional regulator YdeE [Breznakia sp. PF1-11]MDH6411520.1 putative transcriptional regulator YdeE [Breznakia sp. PFB1-11]MDH6413884.1 putative transcriptional regulator YdeE [Breznakia sp. PFB1-14]MDH6416313.1 putative transcriptional regulator YdeE [Breznakia sp. PFB1-4]
MNWMDALTNGLNYIEKHLKENVTVNEVASSVGISPMYFQQSFKIVTGYTVGEYIRNRKLYLAALDVLQAKEKMIDIAYTYGYETPESFSKAFTRMHGVSPTKLQQHPSKITIFQPLRLVIDVKGGQDMQNFAKDKGVMKMIGKKYEVVYETAYQEIPKYWEEYRKECMNPNSKEVAVYEKHHIGEFGVCFDERQESGSFDYYIAGMYEGGEVPEGFTLFEVPASTWMIFPVVGPMPHALQTTNTRIFKEWIPNHPEYEISLPISIEWYKNGKIEDYDFESAIWIPIKDKA